jgi:hypothetical protein
MFDLEPEYVEGLNIIAWWHGVTVGDVILRIATHQPRGLSQEKIERAKAHPVLAELGVERHIQKCQQEPVDLSIAIRWFVHDFFVKKTWLREKHAQQGAYNRAARHAAAPPKMHVVRRPAIMR